MSLKKLLKPSLALGSLVNPLKISKKLPALATAAVLCTLCACSSQRVPIQAAPTLAEIQAKQNAMLFESASRGNLRSQLKAAEMYYKGINGVSRDYEQSLRWYLMAAESGDCLALAMVAEHYENGLGVQKNPQTAFLTNKVAFDKYSCPYSGSRVVEYLRNTKDYENAFKYAKLIADAANTPYEQRIVGISYLFGEGVKKSVLLGIGYLKRAAEQNDARATYILAGEYLSGNNVKVDFQRSFYYFSKAVLLIDEIEEKEKQFIYHCLGFFYENGIGTGSGSNYYKAAEYYRLGAANDDVNSMVQLGVLYLNGRGVDKNVSKAADLFHRAANLGNVDAQCKYGTMHFFKLITHSDPLLGYSWIKNAANNGSKDCQAIVDKVEGNKAGNKGKKRK